MSETQTNFTQPVFKQPVKRKGSWRQSAKNVGLMAFLGQVAFSCPSFALKMVDLASSPYKASSANLVVYSNVSTGAGSGPFSVSLSSPFNSITTSAGSTGSIILGKANQKIILDAIETTPDGSVIMAVSFNYVDKNNKNAGSFSQNFTLNRAFLTKYGSDFDNIVVTLITNTPSNKWTINKIK